MDESQAKKHKYREIKTQVKQRVEFEMEFVNLNILGMQQIIPKKSTLKIMLSAQVENHLQ